MSEGTMRRTIRCEEALWSAAMTKAKNDGVDLSSVIRAGLHEYVDGAGARPAASTPTPVKPKVGQRITVLPYKDCYPVTIPGGLLAGHVKEVTNDVWRALPAGGGKPMLALTRTAAASLLVNGGQ